MIVATHSLTIVYRAQLPCDHCQGTHGHVSTVSQEAAHARAAAMVADCAKARARMDEACANSNRNHRERDFAQAVAFGTIGRRA